MSAALATQQVTAPRVDAGGVFAAFARLSPDDRDVLGLRVIAGFTPAQAAVGLGLTPAAVEQRLAAARRRLRSTAPGIPDDVVTETLRTLC
ncbi:sigma factor-like helix-turn-helix DNA-binding protein [Frondihabitans australicus]|uniref:Sigma-70-like protein n=1 Tax=Frondihabitans australicus TaxID=386892 RepID=A0A495IGW9_9MICO|nr:sigma factor-like helix-turn-helix DNA-binding protein [Frondihabitans australicus]RKR74688.1 sigma-70-like protein [Frondihabitans australicus]